MSNIGQTHKFIELENDYDFSHLPLEKVRQVHKKWKDVKKISIYNIPPYFKKIKYHKLDYKDLYIQYRLDKLERDLRLEISVYFIIRESKKILSQTNDYILRLDYVKNTYGILDGENYASLQNLVFLDCFKLELDYIMFKIFKDIGDWGLYLSSSSTKLTPNPV